MRIIFMGTPHFAVPALLKLINNAAHQLIAVYTKSPKPSNRGLETIKSPIHLLAEEHNIPVFTPRNLRNDDDLSTLKSLKPDIIVVAAYGVILPRAVLDIPFYGCINVHPSALPRWRGAAPIQRTIMHGDTKTAVCIMKMDEGLDTGDIILQEAVNIPAACTALQLEVLTSNIGAEKLIEALDLIHSNQVSYTAQANVGVTYANKLANGEEKIDWHNSAEQIYHQINTFSPRPGAYFSYYRIDNALRGEKIKIIAAEHYPQNRAVESKAGLVIDDQLTIVCGDGNILRPTLLQREGRKMIYTEAFLRGFPIARGSLLK